MNNLFKKFKNIISYSISPPFCEGCKDFIPKRSIFCNSCFNKINPIVSIKLAVTPQYSMQVFAISDYQEPLKSLILAKRRSNQLASVQLSELIWEMTNLKNINFDYLVPIPLHWARFAKRGFNQTEVIASALSVKSNKPVINILKRARYTSYQFSLSASERNENVKGAFVLNGENLINYAGSNLVLVDDLLTSGSTLISAAKELVKLKPASISAVVACRVV